LKRHGQAAPETPTADGPKTGADRAEELRRMDAAKPAPRLGDHQKRLGQFMTPHAVAYEAAGLAGVHGMSVLDPTAGEGRMLKYAREQGATETHGFEVDSQLAGFASKHGVQHGDWLAQPPGHPMADVLLMNPPFTTGGPDTRAIVAKAIDHHWTGKGKAILILPAGPSGDKVIEPYRHMVVAEKPLDEGAFKKEGTGVRTKMYVLENPGGNNPR
jgi:hypothetical protein